MRTSLKTFASVAGLSAILATGVFIGQAMANQPHMQNALGALQSARAELVASAPDKGGHRVKAMALVDEAIAQVRDGMQAAR
jgi:hypothetical protein